VSNANDVPDALFEMSGWPEAFIRGIPEGRGRLVSRRQCWNQSATLARRRQEHDDGACPATVTSCTLAPTARHGSLERVTLVGKRIFPKTAETAKRFHADFA